MSRAAPLPRLVCCGMLERELAHLQEERGWELELCPLPAALHDDPVRLATAIRAALCGGKGARLLAYGACLADMDRLVAEAGARRLHGDNCFALLLGPERHRQAQREGAYFLLEEWARRFPEVVRPLGRPEVVREIFQTEHTHLLALRTPCCGDWTGEAEEVARLTGLPLRWEQAGLAQLGARVDEALAQAGAPPEGPWPTS